MRETIPFRNPMDMTGIKTTQDKNNAVEKLYKEMCKCSRRLHRHEENFHHTFHKRKQKRRIKLLKQNQTIMEKERIKLHQMVFD